MSATDLEESMGKVKDKKGKATRRAARKAQASEGDAEMIKLAAKVAESQRRN